MSALSKGVKLLKILVDPFFEENMIKDVIGVFSEDAVEKFEDFYKKHKMDLDSFFALEDEFMKNNSVPQEKRSLIRENIKQFIKKADLEAYAEECSYDKDALKTLLPEKFKELFEMDAEYDFQYYQRILYSLADYAWKSVTDSSDFEREMIIKVYKRLDEYMKVQESHHKENIRGHTKTQDMISGVTSKLDVLVAPKETIGHNLTSPPAVVDNASFVRGNDVQCVMTEIKKEHNILLVNGFGGVGKTAVAKVLFHEIHNRYKYAGWIEYTGLLKDSILKSACIYEEESNPEIRFNKIMKFLVDNGKDVFLAIDNVDKNEYEDELLKNITGFGMTIIMTSRLNRIKPYKAHEIDFLGIEESIKLFYAHCELIEENEESDTVRKLVEMVQCHTLSVELLAKCYDDVRYGSLTDYHKTLVAKNFTYPDTVAGTDNTGREDTIAGHLKILFNMQNLSDEQKRILYNFSFMPCRSITGKVREWINADINQMNQLIKRGWLLKEKSSYYMHPIVRETVLLGKEEFPNTVGDEFLTYINEDKFFNEEDHYMVTWDKLVIAEIFVSNISDDRFEQYPNVHFYIGWFNNEHGRYKKALGYYEKSLLIRKEVYGKNHPDVATSYNNIGGVYESQGEYEKALGYYEKSLSIRKEVYGENHPDVATSYNNIGAVYDSLGEYEKALGYYERDLRICKEVYGENHPDVATSYNNIGAVYDSLGEYEKALGYYEKSLSIRKEVYGKKHPDVATSYNNIGGVYKSQGEYEKALEYYEKSLDIMYMIFCDYSHPNIITINENIALLYLEQKNYEKAFEYILKSPRLKELFLSQNNEE